jgi:hypothetical protein
MIGAGTVSALTIESLAERRYLKRRRCRISTFVQMVGAERYTLYRAVIHDVSVAGLGLIANTPLPLGLAVVELPTQLNTKPKLATIRIRNVIPVSSSLWRMGAEFTRPIHLAMAAELME